jgi:hypothetical protein
MITVFVRRMQTATAMAVMAPPLMMAMGACWLLRLTWWSAPGRRCSGGVELEAVVPAALPQPTRPLGLPALLQP